MKKQTNFKRWQLILIIALLCPTFCIAQSIQISGTVFEQNGMSVIGASVLEQGTTNGVITDMDGNFQLKVSPNGTLVISYVGYQTQKIPINNQRNFKITLKEDTEILDEVVVVGYGTMKKSDMTGAISSVDTDELVKRATTNPAEALQGKIAGVNIMKSGGNAGAGVSIKIRGVKSFGNNEPLYIVDGFPGDINNINPADIQSLEVLKDGAAAAIYGSVAANGVVIITTKNGKKDEGVKVDFNSYLSFTQVAKKLELLNAKEYQQVHKQMYDNYNQYSNSPIELPEYVSREYNTDTDWQEAMLRSGLSQNYMISLRGGNETAQYSISYNHADEKGIFIGNDFKQDNVRMKMHLKKHIFDIDANLNLRVTDNKQPNYSLNDIYSTTPLMEIYDENNEYGFALSDHDGLPICRNIMADNHYITTTDKTYFTSGNISIGIKLTDWLNFKSGYSYRSDHYRSSYHSPRYIADVINVNEYPYYSESTSYWHEQVFDNVFNFNKEIGSHSINAMIGSSITADKYTWNSIGVEGKTTVYQVENGNLVTNVIPGGFLDENFATINAGAGGTYSGSGSMYEYNRASFFGRINYNFKDRYLIQATVRYDGSSKFGADSRWGCFPSVAIGWRISEEAFFPKQDILNNLKFRASWGRLGNENALGYYDFQALISTYNTKYQGYIQGDANNPWPGSIARGLENRSLRWETTETKNIGFDFGMFNNRLTGNINYYVNRTEDLLITKVLAPSAGLANPILNVGVIRNNGFELELNWSDKVNKLLYNVGVNLSTLKNEVVSLSDENQILYGEGLRFGTEHFPTQTRVGKPIGSFYLYKTDGLFQSIDEVNAYVNDKGELLQPDAKPGDIRFVDTDNNGIINEDDKVYCGSGMPKFEANINLSLEYANFDMSAVISSSIGRKIYNGNRYLYEGMNTVSNFLKSTLDAWTPQNTDTDIPRAVYQDPNSNTRESDRFLENGNFLRLRQLQIGYTLPKQLMNKIKVDKLRFYVSCDNLFTITNYSGIDPEFSRSSVLDNGIDKLIYPFTKSYTVGVQLTF